MLPYESPLLSSDLPIRSPLVSVRGFSWEFCLTTTTRQDLNSISAPSLPLASVSYLFTSIAIHFSSVSLWITSLVQWSTHSIGSPFGKGIELRVCSDHEDEARAQFYQWVAWFSSLMQYLSTNSATGLLVRVCLFIRSMYRILEASQNGKVNWERLWRRCSYEGEKNNSKRWVYEVGRDDCGWLWDGAMSKAGKIGSVTVVQVPRWEIVSEYWAFYCKIDRSFAKIHPEKCCVYCC